MELFRQVKVEFHTTGQIVGSDECGKHAEFCRMRAWIAKCPDQADRWNRLADEWEYIAAVTRRISARFPTARLVPDSASTGSQPIPGSSDLSVHASAAPWFARAASRSDPIAPSLVELTEQSKVALARFRALSD